MSTRYGSPSKVSGSKALPVPDINTIRRGVTRNAQANARPTTNNVRPSTQSSVSFSSAPLAGTTGSSAPSGGLPHPHNQSQYQAAQQQAPVDKGSLAGLDTWTEYLARQCIQGRRSGQPSTATGNGAAGGAGTGGPVLRSELLNALNIAVGKHNETWAELRLATVKLRAREANEREEKLRQHGQHHENQQEPQASEEKEESPSQQEIKKKETPKRANRKGSASSTKTASSDSGAGDKAIAPTDNSTIALENMLVCELLHEVLEESRTRWQTLCTARVAEARKANKNALVRPAKSSQPALEDEPQLPSVDDLYDCLIGGLNDGATQGVLERRLRAGGMSDAASASVTSVLTEEATGISSFGLYSALKPHLRALMQLPTVVPSFQLLQKCFGELHPCVTVASLPASATSSLDAHEGQLDALVRDDAGTATVEGLAAALRKGVHPALRRLLYPRALQCTLSVTEGVPLYGSAGAEFVTTHLSEADLPAYLTCANRHARDKIRRRAHHVYSSTEQELNARAMQSLMRTDTSLNVGNSDRYFVYQDDVEVLAMALAVDKSVPDTRTRSVLAQLGRPETSALDSYVVYLQQREGQLIHQRAPPCGFVPLTESSLLIAPLCNVCGDTVEQYELVAAMTGQLWVRLQGPTPELAQCCLIFEQLVSHFALPACLHTTRVLKLPPLRLAVEWMANGFATVLEPDEVLTFWDLILSYHVRELHQRSSLSMSCGLSSSSSTSAKELSETPCALWLLPLLAAALFVFRAPLVERCESQDELLSVFAISHNVECRTLLQVLLFWTCE